DEAVRAHEQKAAALLRQQRPVAALAELEAALCLCEKRGLEPASTIRRRWQQLASSAVSWSLDFLAEAGLPGDYQQGGLQASDQALEMLCLAEMLTRKEVAETFGASGSTRSFLRALAHAGLGGYYYLRQKPCAALRFLEQAASGQARWVHPAVLLNLSTVHAVLQEAGAALAALDQAVLAIRSATGRLCGEGMQEVEAAAGAARAAVTAVLGPAGDEDGNGRSAPHGAEAMFALDPFGHSLVGEESSRILPGCSLEGASTGQAFGGSAPRQKPGQSRGLGLVSKSSSSNCRQGDCEVDAAVARTLLVAKVLLWPWPEFREQEAVASGAVASTMPAGAYGAVEQSKDGLQGRIAGIAGPGIAVHAAKLKKAWPQWGKPLLPSDAPGAGLVLRECLLLSFLHAAAALAQCCTEPRYRIWVVPPLREGLALAIVLFGPKHPLALKLINACQKVQRPQKAEMPPPGRPPSGGAATGRCRGPGTNDPPRQAGRPRPSSVQSSRSSNPRRAQSPGVAKGPVSGCSTPGSRAPSPGFRSEKPVEASRHETPRGRTNRVAKAATGSTLDLESQTGVLYMQVNFPKSGHGRPERRPVSPLDRSSPSPRARSSERHLDMQLESAQRRRRVLQASGSDLRRPMSAAEPVAGGGLGRRLKARASGCASAPGTPKRASTPSTPRLREPVLSSSRRWGLSPSCLGMSSVELQQRSAVL
ncbi:unnamed protein product, partial [Polarella glacialis]